MGQRYVVGFAFDTQIPACGAITATLPERAAGKFNPQRARNGGVAILQHGVQRRARRRLQILLAYRPYLVFGTHGKLEDVRRLPSLWLASFFEHFHQAQRAFDQPPVRAELPAQFVHCIRL